MHFAGPPDRAVGELSAETMAEVSDRLRIVLGLQSYSCRRLMARGSTDSGVERCPLTHGSFAIQAPDRGARREPAR